MQLKVRERKDIGVVNVSALNKRSCRTIFTWPQKNYFVRFLDDSFYTSYLKILIAAEMGSCFSFLNKHNVEVIHEMLKGKQFDHLRPGRVITYTVDRMYDVPEVKINFDGWYEASVRLWPKSSKVRLNFLNNQEWFLIQYFTACTSIKKCKSLSCILHFFFWRKQFKKMATVNTNTAEKENQIKEENEIKEKEEK